MHALSKGKELATLTVPAALLPHTRSHGDAGGRRVASPCPTLGRGGDVAASATSTLVEVKAPAVIEDAGLGVVDSIHSNGEGYGAVSTTSTPCEEIQRQPCRRRRLRWWVADREMVRVVAIAVWEERSTFNKYDLVCLQAEFELIRASLTILCRRPPTFLAHH